MKKTSDKRELPELISALKEKLSLENKTRLEEIVSLEGEKLKRKKLLIFLSDIYPGAKKDFITLIKNIYISMARNSSEADEITQTILQFLNHPARFKRTEALNTVYEFYYKKFNLSPAMARMLSPALIDCVAITAEVAPNLKIAKGYALIKKLADHYPDEILPLVYDSLKAKKHSCRIRFMELSGDINFEGYLWVERLNPFIMDFLSSEEEELILTAAGTVKKLFSSFPSLMGRFLKPLLDILEKGTEKVKETISEVILEISFIKKIFLLEVITILTALIKEAGENQKVGINLAKALNNLMIGQEVNREEAVQLVMRKNPLEKKEDRKRIWCNFCINLLRESMITQQRFTIKEFLWIFGPEIFKKVLGRLILNVHGDMGSFFCLYHKKNWLTSEGRLKFAHTNQTFTVAHPLDIFFAGQLPAWQKILMEKKVRQPFEQVFRALYSLHMDEITELESCRFAKQQLVTEKAKKAFSEEGFILKDKYALFDWKDSHIQCRFLWDRENTEHSGITITGQMTFHRITDIKKNRVMSKKIPLWQIEPRIFSETVRKLEQVISRGIFRKKFY